MENKATDFLVKCGNPQAFDKTINQLGAAALIQDKPDKYMEKDGCYVMRVFGDPGYVKFAISNQGYGTIVKELPELT